jgi:phage baseplate assembly protein W
MAVIGMCAKTGRAITGLEHVRQSITIIIITWIATRIQLRGFGSHLMDSVSAPGNEATKLKTAHQIAKAVLKWEPRVKVSRVLFDVKFDGTCKIRLDCTYAGQDFEHIVDVLRVAA